MSEQDIYLSLVDWFCYVEVIIVNNNFWESGFVCEFFIDWKGLMEEMSEEIKKMIKWQ